MFLIFWLVTLTSLAATLGLLSWIYDRFGGDLGLSSWRRETVIAVVISLLQATLFWLAVSIIGISAGRMFVLVGGVAFVSYKITHLSNDLMEGTYEMDNGQIVAIAAVQFAILFGTGMLLAILSPVK